jgi:hypothetical protein
MAEYFFSEDSSDFIMRLANSIPVDISPPNKCMLYENKPEPFTDDTYISFYIPFETNEAEIIFANDSGVTLRKFAVNKRGTGTLHVFGSNLTNGVYSYTLYADGIPSETKTMVCSK